MAVFADFGCARIEVTKASDSMASVGVRLLKSLGWSFCKAGIVPGGVSMAKLTCQFSSRWKLFRGADREKIGMTDLQGIDLLKGWKLLCQTELQGSKAHRALVELRLLKRKVTIWEAKRLVGCVVRARWCLLVRQTFAGGGGGGRSGLRS